MNRIRQATARCWAGPWLPPGQGRMPYFWLLSLGYMFWKYAYVPPGALEAALLALTLLVFVPLYFASYWARGWQSVGCMLASCLIGAVWVRWNIGAATFFIFACAAAAGIGHLRHAMLAIGCVIALGLLASLQVAGTQMRLLFLMPILTISLPVGLGAVMDARLRRSGQALLRKQEEVEHLATIAERERISRDLHDLLGHSLSLIALKAELARKLVHRDSEACAREIGDIEASARQALAEVRAAVSGYRESGLAHALAGARASLAAAGVELAEQVEPQSTLDLAPATEHVLALALREAVTNVVRHAGARRCTLSLGREGGNVVLRVVDDGARLRGGVTPRPGNGLAGMQERAAALGGKLALRAGAGLALELRVPAGGAA